MPILAAAANLTRRLRRLGRAALIRAAAGQPLPVPASRDRRGTVLVLILGALALISVITLVYTTVGQGDRRASAATKVRADVHETAGRIGDYLASVVADDTFAVFVDGVDSSGGGGRVGPVLVRKGSQYPFTDPYRRSVITNPPAGNVDTRRFDPTGSYDRMIPGGANAFDERQPSTPWLASTAPTWIVPESGSLGNSNTRFRLYRDWMHISNLSPDGLFVNLWNLRQNFDALCSFQAPPNANSVTGPRDNRVVGTMYHGLVLRDANGNPTENVDGARGLDVNTPAHWSNRQLRAFAPASGPLYYPVNAPPDPVTGLSPNSPGSLWYAPYQWADADGDGFFDSRWFALTDATDPDNPLSFLPNDNRFRWFAAARVIDLSGLVNVNVATDFLTPPRAVQDITGAPIPQNLRPQLPLGLTPADIDLRRLFSLSDVLHLWDFAYDGLRQGVGLDDYSNYDRGVASVVGGSGYDVLRLVLNSNSEAVPPAGAGITPLVFSADDRANYYWQVGGHQTAGLLRMGGRSTFESNARFNLADLLELLTYHGVNNPQSTSRLEQAVDGRDSSGNPEYGPLRSNRSLAADRPADVTENAGLGNGVPDDEAMRRLAADIRRLLTTYSASRPLRAGILPGAAAKNTLDPDYDLRLNARVALNRAIGAAGAGNPKDLFAAYAAALMPHARRSNVWAANNERWRTLFYGNSPEIALRVAAFMTANAIDAADKTTTAEDARPRAFTLLIDGSQRGSVQGNTTDYPWWNDGNGGRLDLGDEFLAKAGDPVTAPAVNIYGIEAQPFLTQIATMILYNDTPASRGGDDEFDPLLPPGSQQGEITINGTVPTATNGVTNPDFLGQFVAFKLTNPFNEEIELASAGTSGEPVVLQEGFYVEFAGKHYPLAEYDYQTELLTPIKLRPRETRVFLAMSDSPEAIRTRWTAAGGPAISPTAVTEFIEAQFAMEQSPGVTYDPGELTAGGLVKPTIIPRFDPSTGAVQTGAADLFEGPTPDHAQVAHLWRILRTSAETPSGSSANNRPENDMLVDRLRVPRGVGGGRANPVLDRRLPQQNEQINGTEAGDEGSANPGDRRDNTGVALALWGTVRRHSNPGNEPLGAIPAYCVEAKWGTTLVNVDDTDESRNLSAPNCRTLYQRDCGLLTYPVPTDDFYEHTRENLASLITKLTQPGATGNSPALIPGIDKPDRNSTATSIPNNLDGRAYAQLYPQIHLNNEEHETEVPPNSGNEVSTLRIVDLLLPFAIGPMHDPNASAGSGQPNEPEPDRLYPGRLTLSEALGIALNYCTPPAPSGGTGEPFAVFHQAGDPQTGFLDRGNLVLDRFAPFEDRNTNGTYEVGQDVPRFPGIPLALHIFNVFNVFSPEYGGIDRGTQGVVNLNTAPPEVLSALPMLAPTTEGANAVWDLWRQQAGLPANGGPTIPFPPASRGDPNGTDVASTLIALRDRVRYPDRSNQQMAHFNDTAGADPFDPTTWDGRFTTTQIPGIAETPGLLGPGAIMTAIDRTGTNGAPGDSRIPRTNQIDHFGVEGQYTTGGATPDNSSIPALVSTVYKDAGGNFLADTIEDDWFEKLQLAAGVMNSVTTRSDTFAAWFVVHGYQRSDVENLGPEDPLVPSIAKRYLMVIDRSNVTKKGQKPKVILFTELPLPER